MLVAAAEVSQPVQRDPLPPVFSPLAGLRLFYILVVSKGFLSDSGEGKETKNEEHNRESGGDLENNRQQEGVHTKSMPLLQAAHKTNTE